MDKSKKSLLAGILIGVIGTCIIGCGVFYGGRLIGSPSKNQTAENGGSTAESLISEEVRAKADAIMAIIDQSYLEKADRDQLTEGIYKGILEGLEDPYSEYFDREETVALEESVTGSYFGIGALLSQNMETHALTLIRCFDDTPAMDAGLLPGDVITKVDGKDIRDLEIEAAVAMIKGPEGTQVSLEIVREGEQHSRSVDLIRKKIDVPTVDGKMMDGQIGYIQIASFDNGTPIQFDTVYRQLEDQGMQGLVIDLRNNPGGTINSVCDIAQYFLPKGLVVYTEDKYGNRQEYGADGKDTFSKPLAVLVNGNSASASEIFAGAVQDTKTGAVVGTTTYGKGVVQQLTDLGDGTVLKLTVSKYYTPNGNNIHEKGITPDVEEQLDEALLTKSVITEEEDNQLQKALSVVKEQLTAQKQ